MRTSTQPNRFPPQQVANRFGVSTTTLSTKRGPLPYVTVGRLLRYRVADVDAFEIARLQQVAAHMD
ncbi:MAG: helix-turn-helix domain-containing protein [Rhodobacteraceae bacterium]|nr:helix-turn-helix domain-containing protein [Paracoccaceae bacterium]